MSEGFMIVTVFYVLFSMLFSLMWVKDIDDDYNFINWYLDRIKNKNAFGKTYVTIFALLALPSYLLAMICLCIYLVLQWLYELGIKIDDKIEEVTE